MIVHNVRDRRFNWIGSWEAVSFRPHQLTEEDRGRTVIYRDYGRPEAGTIVRWNDDTVWAVFHKGDTAAACSPDDLLLAIGTLDGPIGRVRP